MTTFLSDAWRGPSRPCVWCGSPSWNAWQECNKHARRHPWHGRVWQRMVARLEMHRRWDAQYVRRHPEHTGIIHVWAGLRSARLQWHWGGRHGIGYKPDFERAWGLTPKANPFATKHECAGGVMYREGTVR